MGSGLQIRKIVGRLKFPTLFSRLVSVYISILTVTLTVLFMTFSNAFQSYFVRYTQDIMIKQAKGIAKEYHYLGADGLLEKEEIDKIFYGIQVMNSSLQATAWLTDKEKSVIVISEDHSSSLEGQGLPDSVDIQSVFDGNIIYIEDGFKDYFTMPVLTVGYPIEVGGNIEYALFIHTPMPIILQTIDEVTSSILQVVGVIGTFVFVWIYMISKQITKPLKEMNNVAKTISNGQFNKRIVVEGRDEIAELGLSFNNMASELDKIEENRRSFIANVSHDLRSPLTSVQGFVTAILDGTIPQENQEKYLKIVLSESKRMINMTNTILELNKIEESKVPISKTIFNINKMIERIVASFESRVNEKNITLESALDTEHPYVLADIDGISRVVQNLLDNAFKFVNDNGNIRVVSTYQRNKVWIGVCNSGPPIPRKQQKNIWDRFYKGDTSRGKDKRGVGLGLVIVKEIMKQHDEVVGLHSEEGEMVTFYFSLSTAKDS